ncbi:MAG: malate dehydrogenase, partial [Candidatus Omnitrophica bacterium]|nr:malate dehydrogenase [Candidatus Omnitrophota bacterium]
DRRKVIGMGSSLDTNRLFNILYNLTGVAVSSMSGFVYGAHSPDMIVEPQRVSLATKELGSVLDENNLKAVQERVKQRGAEIVGFLKKGSARFGPAAACLKLIEAIAYDKNELLPVSSLLNGEYGLKDVCLGVPCLINRQGIAKIVEVELTKKERLALEKSAKLFKECTI